MASVAARYSVSPFTSDHIHVVTYPPGMMLSLGDHSWWGHMQARYITFLASRMTHWPFWIMSINSSCRNSRCSMHDLWAPWDKVTLVWLYIHYFVENLTRAPQYLNSLRRLFGRWCTLSTDAKSLFPCFTRNTLFPAHVFKQLHITGNELFWFCCDSSGCWLEGRKDNARQLATSHLWLPCLVGECPLQQTDLSILDRLCHPIVPIFCPIVPVVYLIIPMVSDSIR